MLSGCHPGRICKARRELLVHTPWLKHPETILRGLHSKFGPGVSRMGAVAWAIRQRSVSRPRSSNRTGPIKASGSQTGFTVMQRAGRLRGRQSRRSRPCPMAEVVRPAKQRAVQRVTHFGPWIVVARHQQIANLVLSRCFLFLDELAFIPMTVQFVTVRPERVADGTGLTSVNPQ